MTSNNVDVNEILVTVPDYIQKVQCDTNASTKAFKCAVQSCTNTFHNFRQRSTYPYKFHNFPIDPSLRMMWKLRCSLDKDADVSNIKVCSDHFNLDDYVRNYKEEFQNPKFRRTLKKDAVPSKNCAASIFIDVVNEESESIFIVPRRKENVVHNNKLIHGEETPSEPAENKLEIAKKANSTLKMKRNKLLKQEYKLKKEVEDLDKTINVYQREKTSMEKFSYAATHNVLSKVFSSSQIELLTARKKKIYWTKDDLARAFTIRQMGGKSCYLYLKNVLNVPLPALSCVQKWAASWDDNHEET